MKRKREKIVMPSLPHYKRNQKEKARITSSEVFANIFFMYFRNDSTLRAFEFIYL